MFETMKMFLKGKIEASTELVRIQTKLHKFLTSNPDVDHYLCDRIRQKSSLNAVLGILVGLMISVLVFMLISLVVIYYWHALGYLHFPGIYGLE